MTEILYKKLHKKTLFSRVSTNSSFIKHGIYALKVLISGIITPVQVEATRRVISRETKRIGKIFIRIRFDFPVTKKPLLSRMGKGAGPIKAWTASVSKGTIILEYSGLVNNVAMGALQASQLRLPFKTIIIGRHILKA